MIQWETDAQTETGRDRQSWDSESERELRYMEMKRLETERYRELIHKKRKV